MGPPAGRQRSCRRRGALCAATGARLLSCAICNRDHDQRKPSLCGSCCFAVLTRSQTTCACRGTPHTGATDDGNAPCRDHVDGRELSYREPHHKLRSTANWWAPATKGPDRPVPADVSACVGRNRVTARFVPSSKSEPVPGAAPGVPGPTVRPLEYVCAPERAT